MTHLGVWESVPVNKSNRPILTDNEHNIFVKEGVGLYQGRLKIVGYQSGRVYLTNKRIIYLDSADQRRAIAVALRDVLRAEYIERFLRSSPKVKVFLKTLEPPEPGSSSQSPQRLLLLLPLDRIVDWTCVICSFNNHLSTTTNLSTNFPKCVSCGIPPSQDQIEAALAEPGVPVKPQKGSVPLPDQCPKCTFINHPSMRYCELCGTPLRQSSKIQNTGNSALRATNALGLSLEDAEEYTNGFPYIKISFRKGGELHFYESLVEEIDKLKWENLESRGLVSDDAVRLVPKREATPKMQSGGILGLEKIGEFQRKQNELILSLSLEDLEQLMYKAQDLMLLTSSFGILVKKKPKLNPTLTIPPLIVNKNSSLYRQELARHMSEYLLNYELTKVTSMITLQDLFASYNRFRISTQGFGTELITTQDFNTSTDLFDSLELPVKVTEFLSGLAVVVQRNHELLNLHRVIAEYLVAEENAFMYEKFRTELLADSDGYMRDKYRYFQGKTVNEIADHFGWSPAVCIEEMDRCMDEQLVVFDKHILGTFYHVNKFDAALAAKLEDESQARARAQNDVVCQQKQISANLRSQHEADQNLVAFNYYNFGTNDDEPAVEPAASRGASPSDLHSDLVGLTFS